MNGSRRAVVGSVAAAVLLAGGLGLGIEHAVDQARQARTAIGSADRAPRVGNRSAHFNATREQFIAFVVATVPDHDSVRIFLPVREGSTVHAESCTAKSGGPAYWLLVYALVPRASVCGAKARWAIYFGVDPPPGTANVDQFAPGYALVRR